MDDSAAPAFLRIGPADPASPVVLSVPHSGRAYSAGLLGASRLPRAALAALEDPLVDRLIWRAVAGGATALMAQVPRAEIDLNRDAREIDPATISPPPSAAALIQSPRTRGGLGLIPSRIPGSGAIWLRRLPEAELERRLAQVHRPYHDALAAALTAARARFGAAILLDCHSMPPRGPGEAPIVFGDRHGTSMAPAMVAAACEAAAQTGFASACNAPYAGGYITARHGRPAEGLHALQIEIDRRAYLAADLASPGDGFDEVARMIAAVAEALAGEAEAGALAIAAE